MPIDLFAELDAEQSHREALKAEFNKQNIIEKSSSKSLKRSVRAFKVETPGNFSSSPSVRFESLRSFIAEKKEIFNLQFAVNAKKEEILCLKKNHQKKASALSDCEKQLDEDLSKFDQFLLSNNGRAQAAVNSADELSKERQKLWTEASKLKEEISMLRHELTAIESRCQEQEKLREFIQLICKRSHKNEIKNAHEILNILEEIESANVFAMNNLEDCEKKFETYSKISLGSVQNLQSKSADSKILIESYKSKISDITKSLDSIEAEKNPEICKNLTKTISRLYMACGFNGSAETFVMLASIESKFEEWLNYLADSDKAVPGIFAKKEKELEVKRREQLRKTRLDADKAKIDLRLKVSIQRTNAPIPKKIGKQLMTRSPPPRKEKIDPFAGRDFKAEEIFKERFGIDPSSHL